MPRRAALLSLFVCAQVFGLTAGALAQDTSVMANTTNVCINSTYKMWTPSMANPTFILIDRRVNFNPVPGCTTVAMNAFCGDDPGTPMLLSAQAFTSFMQISNNPSCVWNCAAAGCGTITTNGANNGLPVELLDFQVSALSLPSDAVATPALVAPPIASSLEK